MMKPSPRGAEVLELTFGRIFLLFLVFCVIFKRLEAILSSGVLSRRDEAWVVKS